MLTIHKERIELWCAALESGAYEQGLGALRDSGKYCCLGVACDIANPDGWDAGGTTHSECDRYMPAAVATWFGITRRNPRVLIECNHLSDCDERYCSRCKNTGVMEISLALLNDARGSDFTHIAAAIRRTYLVESG